MLRDFKIFYIYVNSHIDKLFEKRKWAGYFITVGIVVWRDDWCGMAEGGSAMAWSFG
jgi:hypothetical protein